MLIQDRQGRHLTRTKNSSQFEESRTRFGDHSWIRYTTTIMKKLQGVYHTINQPKLILSTQEDETR